MRNAICLALMALSTWIIADPIGFADHLAALNAAFFSEIGR